MRLISARQAWHDCLYQGGTTMLENLVDRACWGQVQLSEVDNSLHHIEHQALSGRFQYAISTLPLEMQYFGHNLYAPEVSTRQSNAWIDVAHELVWVSWAKREQLSGEKLQQAYWVARGILYRYRFMVQGGMGNPDPLERPMLFRGWLLERYGVRLRSSAWSREWGWVIQDLFSVVGSLDQQALRPLAIVLGEEKGSGKTKAA